MTRRYLCAWFPMFALNRHQIQAQQKEGQTQHPLKAKASSPLKPRANQEKYPTKKGEKEQENAEQPFALIELEQNARRIMALNTAARQAGLIYGMGLSDARAIVKDLGTADADPETDQRALIRLAHWSRRWCPWVAPVDALGRPFKPDTLLAPHGDAYGLMLDITGSAHLWGGEEALLRDIATRFKHIGYTIRAAIAPTIGAAYGLARFGANRFYRTKDLNTALGPLPVTALRLEAHMVHALHRLGLKTIGQLCPLPRPALARRFRSKSTKEGASVAHLLTQLDRTVGRQQDLLIPLVEPSDLNVRLPLVEPLADSHLLMTVLKDGLDSLLPGLEEKRLGVRLMTLTAYRTDGSLAMLSASCARASLDKDHLLRLFKDRVELIDAGFGIELVELAATRTAPLKQDQRSTLDVSTRDPALMDQLADRLSARLGASAVMRFTRKESWAPERMQGFRPWQKSQYGLSHKENVPDQTPRMPPRPSRLLPRPEPIEVLAEVPDGAPLRFRWRRQMMHVKKAEGPERIAPEWWLSFNQPHTPISDEPRDYFRTEVADGGRFWLYRRGLYPHRAGLEAQGHDAPRWFIHGFFA